MGAGEELGRPEGDARVRAGQWSFGPILAPFASALLFTQRGNNLSILPFKEK